MRRARALLAVLMTALPCAAGAQQLVVSSTPDDVSVTVYREPGRGAAGVDARWPTGYALISEKRRVSLPAGESEIRFDNVAGGMLAVSAVVSGLPGGVSEKNRDARLLSPAALLDGSLGNRVTVRRTNRQTGEVKEIPAVIRSGSGNAVVLDTPDGVEALRCSGLPETILYPQVPDGLTARPSFTVHSNNPQATEAELTLTYLATGFDWAASYVATVDEAGRTLDLFAWLTLANGNDVLYPDARLLAVAGEPNRTSDYDSLDGDREAPQLRLQCWPMDTTSTHPGWSAPVAPPAPPPPPMIYAEDEIVVTGARRSEALMSVPVSVVAAQEELGDLKLYRVPVPVEIAPNAQKQVGLLAKEKVPFIRYYAATISPWSDVASQPLAIRLRMRNSARDGLGLPLPAGKAVVMQRRGNTELLLADTDMRDHAVDEKVELDAGTSAQVRYSQTVETAASGDRRITLTLSNALPGKAAVEVEIPGYGWSVAASSAKLQAKGASRLWAVTVPANGTARLSFTLKQP